MKLVEEIKDENSTFDACISYIEDENEGAHGNDASIEELVQTPVFTNGNNGFIKGICYDINRLTTAKQLAIGGVSGWCTGYLCSKVGKVAATAITGSFVAFHIAQHRGYINVNWKKVNEDLNDAKVAIEKQAKGIIPGLFDQAQKLVVNNAILVTGFAGGFLFGMASG